MTNSDIFVFSEIIEIYAETLSLVVANV